MGCGLFKNWRENYSLREINAGVVSRGEMIMAKTAVAMVHFSATGDLVQMIINDVGLLPFKDTRQSRVRRIPIISIPLPLHRQNSFPYPVSVLC